jgi:triacylglycerol lipase
MIRLLFLAALFSCCCATVNSQVRFASDERLAFDIPQREKNCMQYFNYNETSTMSPVNAFFLAKMSEMMYPERLYYQIRYLQNGQRPVNSISSTDWIERNSTVTNTNFESAFAGRFAHYFFDETKWPRKLNIPALQLAQVNKTVTVDRVSSAISNLRLDSGRTTQTKPAAAPESNFAEDSINWIKENTAQFKFIRQRNGIKFFGIDAGFDPELVVIASPKANFIVFRGTDAYSQIGNKGEWLGTDFNLLFKDGTGPLAGTKVHSGFYESYLMIRNELLAQLNANGGKAKKIWITGHSLGSAMAMVAGVDLKAAGYNVQAVYGFSSPRTIGNDAFKEKGDNILSGRIHRFEYYLDPVTVAGFPFYHAPGKRYWFDEAEYGNMQMYTTSEDRYVSPNPCEFNKCPGDQRSDNTVRVLKARKSGMLTDFVLQPTQIMGYYHNPQFMLKGINKLLSATEKVRLPSIDDSFPYLYGKGPTDAAIPGAK